MALNNGSNMAVNKEGSDMLTNKEESDIVTGKRPDMSTNDGSDMAINKEESDMANGSDVARNKEGTNMVTNKGSELAISAAASNMVTDDGLINLPRNGKEMAASVHMRLADSSVTLGSLDSFSSILGILDTVKDAERNYNNQYYYQKAPRRMSATPDFASSTQSYSSRKQSLSAISSHQNMKQRRHSALPSVPSYSKSGTLVQRKPRRGSAISIGTKRRVSTKSLDQPPSAPDGGYGWVVVFAAFTLQIVFGGFLFSFGLYFVIFLEVFQGDRSTTSWIGSSLNGGFALTAPFSSILSKYFGCRKVILMGQALLAICIFASTFAPNIYVLIALMGVVGGIALGLVYLPTIVIVGYYFEKKRSLAIAICTAGTGVGGIVFPVIIEKLIEFYGWRGSLWIVSGLMIQVFVCASLLRPLTHSEMKVYIDKWHRKRTGVVAKESSSGKFEVNMAFDGDVSGNSTENNSIDGKGVAVSKSSAFDETNEDQMEDDILTDNTNSVTNVDQTESASIPENHDSDRKKCSCIRKGWEAFTNHADIWLLENPIFLLYTTSFTLATVGTRVSTVFMPDYARVIGIPLDWISFLLSVTGIFNTGSKIAAGYVTDKPWMDPLILYSLFVIVGGCVTMTVPVMTMYSHLLAFTIVAGTNIGAISLLNSVNVVDLLGMEKMSGGLGLIMMIGGIAALLSVPFAGWLYDITGTYHATYYLSGCCSLLAGLLCLPLRHIARCIYGTDAELM